MPLAITAETKKLFKKNDVKSLQWDFVSTEEALNKREGFPKGMAPKGTFRCQECKAPVRVHRADSANAAHFEHFKEFEGCSLSRAWDGKKKRNPDEID